MDVVLPILALVLLVQMVGMVGGALVARRLLTLLAPPPPDPPVDELSTARELRHAHRFTEKDADGIRTCRCGARYLDSVRI